MKTAFLSICCMAMVVAVNGQGIAPYRTARVTVRVIDESGIPISNATAVVGFCKTIPPGEGWGTRPYAIEGLTDTNGAFTAQGDGEPSVSCSAKKDGYYPTWGDTMYPFTNAVLGRWHPWNPTYTVVVRKIGNPVPMYAKQVETQIPRAGEPFGFDLEQGDWVRPVGKGDVSDFVFRVDGYWSNRFDNAASMTLTFANSLDGIQKTASNEFRGSVFVSPREPPQSGYQAKRTWRKIRKNSPDRKADINVIDYEDRANYLFRVRTETNEQGTVISTLYGRVHGDIEYGGAGTEGSFLKFTYYLNPTPNDRNLEFDPDRNLFTGLSSREQVREP